MNGKSTHRESVLRQELDALSDEQRQLFKLLLEKDARGSEGLGGVAEALKDHQAPPLSFTQERIWSVSQLTPDLPVENVPISFRLKGALNVDLLAQAVESVASRHAILRTRFVEREGQLVQHRVKTVPRLKVVAASEEELPDVIRREAHHLFDYEGEDLIRFHLARLSHQEHVLIISTHQLLTDGHSFRLLLKAISNAYVREQSAGAEDDHPEIQYAHYAAWQRQQAGAGVFNRELDYWLNQLGDAPHVLPIGKSSAGGTGPQCACTGIRFVLDENLSRGIRAVGRENGVTTFMTMTGALQVTLARAAGVSDVTVGTLISNRNRPETETMIGNCANNLLLRLKLESESSFRDVLNQVRDRVVGAYSNQEAPFQLVANQIRSETGKAEPAFQVMMMIRDSDEASNLTLPDIEVTQVNFDFGYSRLDLSLDVTDSGSGPMKAKLDYKSSSFTSEEMSQLVENYVAVLHALVNSLDTRVHSLVLPHNLSLASRGEERRSSSIAPRNDTERELLEIWRNVFRQNDIGVEDNFFDLGGRSLTAIEVMNAVRERFDRHLPIATVYRAPSVRSLAEVVDGSSASDGYRWLVPLKAGSSPPLFVVHGFGGSVMFFRQIAELMSSPAAVYGIHSRVLDGEPLPSEDIRVIAREYAEEIISANPTGPYRLTAHCAGGFIAFEVAQQLREMGKDVDLLALLDAVPPSMRDEYERHDSLWARLDRTKDAHGVFGAFMWMPGALARGLYRRLVRKNLVRFRAMSGRLFARSGRAIPQWARQDYARKVYTQVAFRYRPRVFDGTITLIRSSESQSRELRGDLGWEDYAGAVDVFDIDVAHGAMIREDGVAPAKLAGMFDKVLRRRSASVSTGSG